MRLEHDGTRTVVADNHEGRPSADRTTSPSSPTAGGSIVFSEGDGIGDGIKTGRAGNVFSTGGAGPGIVRIMAPDGKLLGTLNLPVYGGEPKRQICATNVAFGGNDGRSLYITACDAVYRIRLRTPGIVPGPPARAGGNGTLGHR